MQRLEYRDESGVVTGVVYYDPTTGRGKTITATTTTESTTTMALAPTQIAEIHEEVEKFLRNIRITLTRDDIIPPIEKELKELIAKALEPVPEDKKASVKAKIVTSKSDDDALSFLRRYGSPGNALKPILLIGGQGSGKTTAAKQFAYNAGFQHVVVFEGHEGVEAMDMVGGLRPYPDEKAGTTTIWQDGKVAYAFRMAARGDTTCLYIDEFYRIKVRERSPLIAGLSPFRMPDGVEYYTLSTGRILGVKDGVVIGEETIFAPIRKLTIIASTNVGAGFEVQMGDPAEAGRWLQYDMETTEEKVRTIVSSVLDAHGFDKALVGKFVKILNEGQHLKNDNYLALAPDVRILCDGIKLANDQDDIGNALYNAALVWVGRAIDGKRSVEQSRELEKLIRRHFALSSRGRYTINDIAEYLLSEAKARGYTLKPGDATVYAKAINDYLKAKQRDEAKAQIQYALGVSGASGSKVSEPILKRIEESI